MKAECIYSPACQLAARERGITSATMNKQVQIQTQAVAWWLMATLAGFTTTVAAAEVFFCMAVEVYVFVGQIYSHY